MMKIKRRFAALLALIILLFCQSVPLQAAESKEAEVIFTHDLHSHLEGFREDEGGKIQMVGGFARLKTVIDEKRRINPDLLVVDAGDFSMGTLYQTIYEQEAAELRMMGYLGFDATTLGNHEFDYRTKGLLNMMEAAKDSGDRIPEVLLSNAILQGTPFEALELKPYMIFTKGDLRIAVFGIFGEDALVCAPTCEMRFRPAKDAAREVVEQIKQKENADLIVCISHSGTNGNPKKSEDELLAKAAPDIDLIISGHSHTVLEEPIRIDDTYIVSSGEYGRRIGNITLKQKDDGRWELKEYSLIPLSDEVLEDEKAKEVLSGFRSKIDDLYLKQFGYSMDQVLTNNLWDFTPISEIGKVLREEPLGNLIADSYRYAVEKAEGDAYIPVAAAVIPSGTIRESLPKGEITVADAFNMASLGTGPDGTPGYPLVSVYLTGKELMTAAEIDASVSPFMNTAELYWNGLHYAINKNRIILNKVTDIYLMDDDGQRREIEPDRLYRVIADLYSGQMLSAVTEKSYGILSLQPKDVEGNIIEDFETAIVYEEEKELKLWKAIADYLASNETVPEIYREAQGRKVISVSWNPVELLKKPNKTTLIIYAGVLFVIVIVVSIVRIIVKKRARRQ